MLISKRIATLGIFFLLISAQAQAFEQDYRPDDPGLVYQDYLNMINIKPSWSDDIKVNKEVIVAVLDSGFDLDHVDLVDNYWVNPGEIPGDGLDNDKNSYIDDVTGWDFIDSDNDPSPDLSEGYDLIAANHGTVIAGIVAASLNGQGIVGVAPQAKIMPLRILDKNGSGNTIVLSQAIDYAVESGADVINLSLVGELYDEPLQKSIKNAYEKGVMIVAASGNENNEGISLDIDPHYPVCDIDSVNRVLGVAAVNRERKLTPFSNYGEQCIDISAPGVDFYSTVYNDPEQEEFTKYYNDNWSGTSVAAPTVAGTIALIKMNYPDFRPYDIYNIITSTAKSLAVENPIHKVDLGSGLLDVGAALNLAQDYDNDIIRLVLAPQAGLPPEILVMDTEAELRNVFLAYAAKFTGGVNLATGDLDGDGYDEIVTAPMVGGGPHIRVFDRNGNLQSEFFAYVANFYGGVNVAVGDVNADGVNEIVTAPMAGGGPHIRVFDRNGNVVSEFFAYEANFYGGVNVAVGDVNADGVNEIVTAPMGNYRPLIRVFDHRGRPRNGFLAYDEKMINGVNISVGDVNFDNWPEIITVQARNQAPSIKLFNVRGRLKGEFKAYTSRLNTGIQVLARDISGDLMPEIVTLPERGVAALLKVYDALGLEKDGFYVRNEQDKNGYNLEILAR